MFLRLGIKAEKPDDQLGGVGSVIETGLIATSLRFRRDDGVDVTFRASLAVCLQADVLETSILGRDILDHFALIVDRPGNVICMLRDNHTYQVVTQR